MTDVIAERALSVDGDQAGAVRVRQPFQQDGYWRCDYEIDLPERQHHWYCAGQDSWQALQLAMQMIPVELSATEAFKAGQLNSFGVTLRTDADLIEWLGLRPMKALAQ